MNHVCIKCGHRKFKTVRKGRVYACRRCGGLQVAEYAMTRASGEVRLK